MRALDHVKHNRFLLAFSDTSASKVQQISSVVRIRLVNRERKMETGKKAAASEKETASNIAAAAKVGMEKTRATLVEKGEKMTAHDPLEKQLALEKKEERKSQAEAEKLDARERQAAEKEEIRAHHTGGPTSGQPQEESTSGGTTTAGHPLSGSGKPQSEELGGSVQMTVVRANERVSVVAQCDGV